MIKVNGIEVPLGTPGVGVPAGGGSRSIISKEN